MTLTPPIRRPDSVHPAEFRVNPLPSPRNRTERPLSKVIAHLALGMIFGKIRRNHGQQNPSSYAVQALGTTGCLHESPEHTFDDDLVPILNLDSAGHFEDADVVGQ